jgi:acetylornithine deacetylase/succinyl-diaminopimelate desuccinylase-like protein
MGIPSDVLPDPIFERALSLLTELTSISSPSGDAEGLNRMAQRFGYALRERGLAVEIRDEPSDGGQILPVLFARGPRTEKGHLLLIGHLDTVLPAAEPHLDGGRLVATGAIDMKGGLAAFLGALDLLRDRGQVPPPDLLLVAVPDEEVGGTLSKAAIRQWGETARALWVLEPGDTIGGAETIVAGRRGMFQWRLDVRGQAAHSGLHYWEGRSALAAAARWVTEAEALAQRDGGPTINTGRLVAGDTTFVDDLAGAHTFLGTERQLNIVPDRAVAEGEARFLRAGESAGLAQRLETLARDIAVATGTEISFAKDNFIQPVDPKGPHCGVCHPAWLEAGGRRRARRHLLPQFPPRPQPHPRPRRPGAGGWGDAHAGGVRGSRVSEAADCVVGRLDGGGWCTGGRTALG